MQVRFRLVAMVLVMALAGGAQACLALCASPVAKPSPTASAPTPAPEKPSSCHRCPSEKAPADPAPAEPATPCKQCQTASQDRLAAERDGSILKTAFELSFLPFIELTPESPTLDRSFEVTRPGIHSPPGERLHQFCLLLI